MRRVVLYVLGVLLIVVGLTGLVVPVMPGWFLIFAGLSMIAPGLARKLKHRFFRKFFKKEIIYLDEWKRHGVEAGFTTRHLPLVLNKTDDLLEVSNQEKLAEYFLGHKKFVLLNQVHGDRVQVLESAADGGFIHLPETDGVITNRRDLTLLVLTADCLPIFFRAGDWIGLVHAGWRGTKSQIAKKAFRLMLEKTGYRPSQVHVLFGPCIRRDHYEVGKEFGQFFPRRSLHKHRGKLFFDLPRENRRQLLKAGARLKNIDDYEICTACETRTFYSFRREGDTAGRMVAFIAFP